MNIKISIKDCDCIQGISSSKQLSQVEHKKRTMLYAAPQHDKSTKARIPKPNTREQVHQNKKTSAGIDTQSKQYRESQKQMLNELKKNGKNHATLDMVQTSNNILQKQNQIIEQNQKTLYELAGRNRGDDGGRARDQIIIQALEQTKREVEKMRNQIVSAAQQFNRNLNQAKNNKQPQKAQIPPQISTINSNMKNLVQASQNHIQGLQNLEALKSLQNFNMQSYNQAISTLKKQIAQYLKESQNIERQLKIRSAKLEKLDMPPQFQQQLYRPYQEHLQNRVKGIDLHAIRERVYQKIGGFDYGKFENDVGALMVDVRGELANFNIVCKEFAITVPDIRIDQKQLKNLDMKLPSVLDQYKAAKGIKFEQPQAQQQQQQQAQKSTAMSRTAQLQQRLKQTQTQKKPAGLPRSATQPLDLAHQAKLTKQSDKRPTILENEQKKEKRDLEDRMKKGGKEKKMEDEQFEKYLENRAREQLELLYKQKKQRLQKMQNELYQQVTNPVYIDLSLKKQQVLPKKQSNPQKPPAPQQQYSQQFEQQIKQEQEQGQKKKKKQIEYQREGNQKQHTDIKQMGREILKQKLKNLLGQKNKQSHISRPTNFIPQQNVNVNGERQMQNIAEGFIAMINNTLTQVNHNLAKSIEKKMEYGHDRKGGSLQKRQPKKISVPKLQSFRPPPVFNINLSQPPSLPSPFQPQAPPHLVHLPQAQQQKKIVVQNYDKYRIKNENNYNEFQISSDEQGDDV